MSLIIYEHRRVVVFFSFSKINIYSLFLDKKKWFLMSLLLRTGTMETPRPHLCARIKAPSWNRAALYMKWGESGTTIYPLILFLFSHKSRWFFCSFDPEVEVCRFYKWSKSLFHSLSAEVGKMPDSCAASRCSNERSVETKTRGVTFHRWDAHEDSPVMSRMIIAL